VSVVASGTLDVDPPQPDVSLAARVPILELARAAAVEPHHSSASEPP
jgi:hypothetical protein